MVRSQNVRKGSIFFLRCRLQIHARAARFTFYQIHFTVSSHRTPDSATYRTEVVVNNGQFLEGSLVKSQIGHRHIRKLMSWV